jgi:uncharacterized membrane protein
VSEEQWLDLIGKITLAIELAGIAVIVVGALVSAALFARNVTRLGAYGAYRRLRANLGRSFLLGLELLVAGDIVNTVAIEPTMNSVLVLAGIVAIRTFLSLSLEVEIEGRWPWQRGHDGAVN